MKFRGVDLNLLFALEALLEEKSVTRAAHRLRISQPGMSAALQKLRQHYADLLLEPVGHQFVLTQRAQQLQEPVTAVLGRIRTLVSGGQTKPYVRTGKKVLKSARKEVERPPVKRPRGRPPSRKGRSP